MMDTVGVAFGIFFVFFVILVLMYNSLVAKKNQVLNVFSSTDVLLKKRYDLIPNLVETVKTYMQHEKSLLTEVTELRTQATSGRLTDEEKVDIDNRVTAAIGGLMVAVENYPDLKANQNFLQLQQSLNEVEEQISAARRAYNASVLDYNNAVEMFPSSIIASMINYKQKPFFVIAEKQRENLDVRKLFGTR